jgi:hypothetical protein
VDFLSLRVATPPAGFDMTVSGASVAGSYLASQQMQPLTQQKRTRHPSISDVKMEAADAANAPSPASPSGKAGHKIDITA